MKKWLKRNIAKVLILSCIIPTLGFYACTENNPNNNQEDKKASTLVTAINYNDGIHTINMEKTNEYILKNSTSEYQIVISADADLHSLENSAARELKEMFFTATGVALPIVTDEEINSASGKFFSIGENKLSQEAKIVFNSDVLKSQGYVIKTVGNNVYMGGAGGYGTLYSVYGFAELTLGYDYYYTDSIEINRGLTDLPLYNYDVVDVPDIEYRDATYGFVTASEDVFNGYRMLPRGTYIAPIGGMLGHNAFKLFGKDENLKTHPDWFDHEMNPTQPCFTAHGKEEERAAMLAYGVEVLKQELIAKPDAGVVLFCIEDTGSCCLCPACRDAIDYYGSISGTMVAMANDLKRAIDAWFEEDGVAYKREWRLAFYAYNAYEKAPTQNIRCEKGVVPYVCPINTDYMLPLTHEANGASYTEIEKWKNISDDMQFYYYDLNYWNYFAPYNTFDSLQENYRYAAASGASCIHTLGNIPGSGAVASTGFSVLKVYLESKLGWNVNADVEALIDKFFEGYYDVGADWVRKYFDEFRLHAVVQNQTLGYNGPKSLYHDAMQATLWPKKLLERWIGYMENAMDSIIVYKETDPTLYLQLYNHIAADRIDLYFMYVEIYNEEINEDLKLQYRRAIKSDAEKLGLKSFSERSRSELALRFADWGI